MPSKGQMPAAVLHRGELFPSLRRLTNSITQKNPASILETHEPDCFVDTIIALARLQGDAGTQQWYPKVYACGTLEGFPSDRH